MERKKIDLKTVDGFTISAEHTIAKKAKVVLWLHGIAESKNEFGNLFKDGAEYLASHGVDSIRIDFRGHGKSSGKSTDFTLTGQLMDIDSAIKYYDDFYKAKETSLHVVGCSFGSPPALFSALAYDKFRSVTLIAPVLSYQRTFLTPETEWGVEIFNQQTIEKLKRTNKLKISGKFSIGMQLYKEMQLIDPVGVFSLLTTPTSIIHGDVDSMVPFQVSKDVSIKYPNVRLHTIKNMDHGFPDADDEKGIGSKSLQNKNTIFEIIINAVN